MADKILILDDNAPLVDAIRAILERERYTVDTSLMRSVEDVERSKPDLIIIDTPPGKRAKTVNFVQCLRLNPATARSPVIIMTTLLKGLDAGLLRDRGIHVLNKPFELDELLSSVDMLLRHGKQTAQSND